MSRFRSRKGRKQAAFVPFDAMSICPDCGCVVADLLEDRHRQVVHGRRFPSTPMSRALTAEILRKTREANQ